MRETIRSAVSERLRDAGLDAYIAVTPANFFYVSGFKSPFLELSWQMSGTDMAVLFADESTEPALIVSEYAEPFARLASDIDDIHTYAMWTEGRPFADVSGRAKGLSKRFVDRPMQFEADAILALLKKVLMDRGLTDPKLGTDTSLMKHETWLSFAKVFGGDRLTDCREFLYELRATKQAFEIDRIRRAASLFDAGIAHCAANIQIGHAAADLRALFDTGVANAVARQEALGPVEGSFVFEHIGIAGGRVGESDIVKLDCGVKVDGYWSDACRHFSIGDPKPEHVSIHNALTAGFKAAEALIGPNVSCRAIYESALTAVRSNGLPYYSRGHFGHSIGIDNHQEEPPFLGPCDDKLKPGMIICLEVPYYPADVGGFNIEDMYLVTESGHERLTHLPRDLIVLG